MRGFSLAEAVVSTVVLGVLFLTVLAMYVIGSHAWARGDVQSQLLSSLQVPLGQLSRALEQTVYASITLDEATGCSLLSSSDPESGYLLNDEGRPRWRRYQIFYQDGQRLLRRDLPLVDGADQETVPAPIELYDSGSGPLPLPSYRTGEGAVLGRNLIEFTIYQVPATHMFSISVTAEKERYGRPEPERMSLATSVSVRR